MEMLNLNAMIGIVVDEKRFRTEMFCPPKIYFLLSCKKGGLCLNDLNIPKLNYVQKIAIYMMHVSSFLTSSF